MQDSPAFISLSPVAEPRLPDYPPVAETCFRTLPAWLPACCRPIACLTTRLLPTHRLSDCPPVADPSPVRLPACCRPIACRRPIACPTARLLPTLPVLDFPLRLFPIRLCLDPRLWCDCTLRTVLSILRVLLDLPSARHNAIWCQYCAVSCTKY